MAALNPRATKVSKKLVAEMKPVAFTFVKSNLVASTFVTSRTTFVKKCLQLVDFSSRESQLLL
jgi:hypothetical protein